MSEREIITDLACPECGKAKNLTGRGTQNEAGFWITRWLCEECGCKFTVEEFDEDDGSLQSKREKRRHWFSKLRWKRRPR